MKLKYGSSLDVPNMTAIHHPGFWSLLCQRKASESDVVVPDILDIFCA